MKVLFLDTVHSILAERLQLAGAECIHAENWTYDEIRAKLPHIHGIVVRSRFPMNATFLEGATQLEFIARSGAGMENIDVEFCAEKNIILFNAPEGNRNAVGEHALGMLLAVLNKLHSADREVRNGVWEREANRGIELDGKTVGIIGYGNNGAAFAKKLRGFDVKILAHDKYKTGFGDQFVIEASKEDILEQADIVSFHIPQNDETVFYFDQEFIDKCKKPIWLINLSRGRIVHTRDLVEGLKSGKVKGACLDVLEYEKSSFESFFEQELPLELVYLLKSDQVILSPHVGGWTAESYFKLSAVLADKILEHYKGVDLSKLP
jgi:D-3-phosphoglycerate dehydrogenase / 2-oxoglutarate reductase